MRPDTTAPHPGPDTADHHRFDTLGPGGRALALAFALGGIVYLGWRATSFHPDAPVFSALLFAAELMGFVSALLFLFLVARLSVRTPPRPDADLLVDVFVVADHEPLSEVRRTLSACRRLRYPHATWLLDAGGEPERAELAAELGVQYAGPGTLTRRGLPHRARGHAVAVFGADHVPARDFLVRTLGYLRDARVGFVATRTESCHLDAFPCRPLSGMRARRAPRPARDRLLQRGRDVRNAVIAPGSGVVFRRAALDALHVVRFGSRNEDVGTSRRLQAAGWRGVFHDEMLAFRAAREVPGGRVAHRRPPEPASRRPVRPLPARGLTVPQRLAYWALVLDRADPWRRLVYYAVPVVVFTTGWLPVASPSDPLIALGLLHHALGLTASRVASRGHGRGFERERHGLMRLTLALAAWRHRRTPGGRAPMAGLRGLLLPPSGLAAANALAIPLGVTEGLTSAPAPGTREFALSAGWAGMNALLAARTVSLAAAGPPARRQDYRFPIALPAMLNSHDTRLCIGVIDQVSATGFRYRGILPRPLSPGEFFTGQALLPTGAHPFLAEVRRVEAPGGDAAIAGLGASFIWPVPRAGDPFTDVIYGSDLQWRLNGLAARCAAPETASPEWAATLCRNLAGAPVTCPGIVTPARPDAAERILVLSRRLPGGVALQLRTTSRHGIRVEDGHAERLDAFRVEGAPLYAYRFRPAPLPA